MRDINFIKANQPRERKVITVLSLTLNNPRHALLKYPKAGILIKVFCDNFINVLNTVKDTIEARMRNEIR